MFAKKDSKEKPKAKENINVEKPAHNAMQSVAGGEEIKPEIKEEEINKEHKYLDNWKRCQADFENYKKRQ